MASLHEIIPLVFLFLVTFCLADDPLASYCNPQTIIRSSSSPVFANIDHLLADTVQKFQTGARFIEASYGQGQAQIYGLAQCRGDVGQEDCLGCIKNAAQQIRKLCSNQSDARIWYDFCFLRYSQTQFFGKVDTSYGVLYANVENVTDPDSFNNELGDLFDKIDSVAVQPSSQGLGKDQKKLSDFDTLYGLVQCTRDMSTLNCAQCLAIAIHNFEGFCRDKKGCRVLYSSCYVRYELYPFFFPVGNLKNGGGGRGFVKKLVVHH